jgi:hypothetical protein
MFKVRKSRGQSGSGENRHLGRKALVLFLASVMVAVVAIPTFVLGDSSMGGGMRQQAPA